MNSFFCILYCPGKAKARWCSKFFPTLQYLCEMQSAQLTVELMKYCDEYFCNTLYNHTLFLILRFTTASFCKQLSQEQFCHYTISDTFWWMTNYLHIPLLSTPPHYLLSILEISSVISTAVLTMHVYPLAQTPTVQVMVPMLPLPILQMSSHEPQIRLYQLPPLVLLTC